MLTVDRLHVDMDVDISTVIEKAYYAVMGNMMIRISNLPEEFHESVVFDNDEEIDNPESYRKKIEIYYREKEEHEEQEALFQKYLMEAKATEMHRILSWIKEDKILSSRSENIKESMKKLDALAYLKAEELFWKHEFDVNYAINLEKKELI